MEKPSKIAVVSSGDDYKWYDEKEVEAYKNLYGGFVGTEGVFAQVAKLNVEVVENDNITVADFVEAWEAIENRTGPKEADVFSPFRPGTILRADCRQKSKYHK